MEYRSAASLGRFARIAIGAVVAMEGLLLLSLFAQYALIGVPIEQAPPDGATGMVAMSMCCAGLSQLGALVVAAVLFLRWVYVTSQNAQSLGAALEMSPGYAVGCWFIPFANIVLPLKAMQGLDSAAASDAELEKVAMGHKDVIGWWVLYILAGVGSSVGSFGDPGVLRQLVGTAALVPLHAASAFLLFGVMRRITAGLDRKAGVATGDAPPVQF